MPAGRPKNSSVAVEDSPETALSANAENTSPTENFNTSASPITTDALLTLIAGMQQQLLKSQEEAAKANAALAAAILETTKPREVLKTKEQLAREANDKLFDENAKELRRRQRETIRQSQDECVHIAGCSPLSEQKDIAGRTSILWHRNDAQVDIGICTVCQRIFHPDDPVDGQGHSYTFWRKQPSFNKISAAGIRQFLDPMKARKDSYLHDS
jgi:hypothetical protein